jgi:hypothetical protein
MGGDPLCDTIGTVTGPEMSEKWREKWLMGVAIDWLHY